MIPVDVSRDISRVVRKSAGKEAAEGDFAREICRTRKLRKERKGKITGAIVDYLNSGEIEQREFLTAIF